MPPPDEEALRIYLILPAYDRFNDSKNHKQLQTPFGRAALKLERKYAKILSTWWSNVSMVFFERLVGVYKRIVNDLLRDMQVQTLSGSIDDFPSVRFERSLYVALKMLHWFFIINARHRKERLPYETFYMTDLKTLIDLKRDYFNWITNHGSPPNVGYIAILSIAQIQ